MTVKLSIVDGIVSYMRKQAGPSAKDLPNAETFNKFISNEEPSVIGKSYFILLPSEAYVLAACPRFLHWGK